MTCPRCDAVKRDLAGQVNPDPLSLSSKDLVALACAVARLGSVICDLGVQGGSTTQADEEPYIWDIEEPHAHH